MTELPGIELRVVSIELSVAYTNGTVSSIHVNGKEELRLARELLNQLEARKA